MPAEPTTKGKGRGKSKEQLMQELEDDKNNGSGGDDYLSETMMGWENRIDIKDIKYSDDPVREVNVKAEAFQRLIDSMNDEGIRYPVYLTRNNQLVDGHRRVAAAKFLKWKDIPFVRLMDNEDVRKAEVTTNDTSETLEMLDIARRIAIDYKEGREDKVSLRDLGRKYNRSHAGIKFLISVHELNTKTKRLIRKGEISAVAAVKESTASPAVKKEVAAMLGVGDKPTRKDADPTLRTIKMPKEGLSKGLTITVGYNRTLVSIPAGWGDLKNFSQRWEVVKTKAFATQDEIIIPACKEIAKKAKNLIKQKPKDE